VTALHALIERAGRVHVNAVRVFVPNGSSDWQYLIWLDNAT
jgi:hypothetical protein